MTQTMHPTSATGAQPKRGVGWLAVAGGLALIFAGQKAFYPASFGPFIFLATLVLYLGMIPIASWMANSLAARITPRGTGLVRAAQILGIIGALAAAATALLAFQRWLPAVPAQIAETSSLGVIGLWLLIANVQAFRARLFNRVLALFGVLIGVGWLLATAIMWAELSLGSLGGLVATLENLRQYGGILAQLFYLIWALWLGIWLLVRKR